MFIKKQGLYIFLCLLFTLVFLPVQSFAQKKVDFKTYKNGMELVKEQNKKAFIYFHADWCQYCKKMEKEVFSNADVIEYLNENFISLKVDTVEEEEIADKYNAKRLPMLFFLKKDGSVLTYRPGYVEADDLLYMLKYINTDSYLTMDFKDFVNQN